MKTTRLIFIHVAICVAVTVLAGNLQASGDSALTKQAGTSHIDSTEMVPWQRLEYAQKHAEEKGKTVLISVDQMKALLDFIVSDKFGTLSFDEFLSEEGG